MQKNEIHIIYGQNPRTMTIKLLESMQIAKELNPSTRVAIKPNLVVAKPATTGATTTPEIVEGVIHYLYQNGIKQISIMEGSWVGDSTKRAFKVCGYEDLAKKYGIPLYDLKEDSCHTVQVEDLTLKVCKKPLEADYLINIPVLKAHCQTLFTCALKNLKGCIPDSEKRRFHSLGLAKPIGYLSKAIPCGLIIVDAMNGDLTFEEGGNPVQMDRIIAGKDPVLIDAYGAALLGYDSKEIEYIPLAEKVGGGLSDLALAKVIEHESGFKTSGKFLPSQRTKQLAKRVNSQSACSACYGSLIHALQRLSDKGLLSKLTEPISIGQAFRGKSLSGIGIGQCTSGFKKTIPGCPPSAKTILEYLESEI